MVLAERNPSHGEASVARRVVNGDVWHSTHVVPAGSSSAPISPSRAFSPSSVTPATGCLPVKAITRWTTPWSLQHGFPTLQVILLDSESIGFMQPEGSPLTDEDPGTPHEATLIVRGNGLMIVSVSELRHDLTGLIVDQPMNRDPPRGCGIRPIELDHQAPNLKLLPRAGFLEILRRHESRSGFPA